MFVSGNTISSFNSTVTYQMPFTIRPSAQSYSLATGAQTGIVNLMSTMLSFTVTGIPTVVRVPTRNH